MKELLDIRKRKKNKKPAFNRTDSYKVKGVPDSWRRPKGYQNKMRLERHGKPAVVKVGYRTPSKVRGLSAEGLQPFVVRTIVEIEALTKEQGAILGNVGMKKKAELLAKCKEKGIAVFNVKNIDEAISGIQSKVDERKAKRKEALTKKAQKEKEKPKKEPEKKEKVDEEEHKKQEKQEMEKLVTKKEQ